MTNVREDMGHRNSQSLLVGGNWPDFSRRKFDVIQERTDGHTLWAEILHVRILKIFYSSKKKKRKKSFLTSTDKCSHKVNHYTAVKNYRYVLVSMDETENNVQ